MHNSIQIMQEEILRILKDNNPSIYLFGSIVLDDFKLGWSDIDILCVTEKTITKEQAEELVNLRQALLDKYPGNPYFRSFEGGFLTLEAFFQRREDNVVYWGTSGQRITNIYSFDVFSTMELIDSGRLLYGRDIRDRIGYPKYSEIVDAVRNHYHAIRKYAVVTGRSLYSAGWLFDIARCIYSLQTGKIIAKTAAGQWAVDNKLAPNIPVLKKVLEIRKNPMKYKTDEPTLEWLETLGQDIQNFADVLEKQLSDITSSRE